MSYHVEEIDGDGETVQIHSAATIGHNRRLPFDTRDVAEVEAEKLHAATPEHTFAVVKEAGL